MARFAITDITKQYFRKFLKRFKNSPYLGYKSKQVHNESTKDYFFLIEYITKQINSQRRVRLRTKVVKSGVNEKIGHINKKNQSEELENINVTTT